jgi:hypothetical protein
MLKLSQFFEMKRIVNAEMTGRPKEVAMARCAVRSSFITYPASPVMHHKSRPPHPSAAQQQPLTRYEWTNGHERTHITVFGFNDHCSPLDIPPKYFVVTTPAPPCDTKGTL